MQKLTYALRLGLLTGLCLLGQHSAPARALAATPARATLNGPQAAATTRRLTPPAQRHRLGRLRRASNPAAGFGRDYFRPHRRPSQRKPDSFRELAQQWWNGHRPL